MDTKARILQTALNLFNEQGVEVVTVRHIAKEMNISHGNLCYHFPNTDAIISRLYDQLVEELNHVINPAMTAPEISLMGLASSAKSVMTILHDYRFMMLDFAGIMRRIPSLRDRHRTLVENRNVVFRHVLAQLRALGLFREELYPGHDDDLLEQVFIVGDFWLSSATILYEGPEEHKLAHYQRVFLALFVPLMTDKGIAKWKQTVPLT